MHHYSIYKCFNFLAFLLLLPHHLSQPTTISLIVTPQELTDDIKSTNCGHLLALHWPFEFHLCAAGFPPPIFTPPIGDSLVITSQELKHDSTSSIVSPSHAHPQFLSISFGQFRNVCPGFGGGRGSAHTVPVPNSSPESVPRNSSQRLDP